MVRWSETSSAEIQLFCLKRHAMICSKKSSSQRKQVYKYPSIPNHMVNEPKIQQNERALTDNSFEGDKIAIAPS